MSEIGCYQSALKWSNKNTNQPPKRLRSKTFAEGECTLTAIVQLKSDALISYEADVYWCPDSGAAPVARLIELLFRLRLLADFDGEGP